MPKQNKGTLETKTHYFWPTKQQELLLRAALLKGEDALRAWHDWKSSLDIKHIDSGSYRLLPLLYRNLQAHGVRDVLLNELEGIYRQTWCKNQILFHSIASLLRSFGDAGIETMILKGASLVLLAYKDYGLRPMGDLDILVHTGKVLPAIAVLKKQGWTPISFDPNADYISVRYSHGFEDTDGRQCDLHWHLLPQCCQPDADDDFWAGAALTKIRDVSTYVLNPADQLLHICIHGTKWDVTPTFRWVADAMMILQSTKTDFAWDRLIQQARKRHLVLPLIDTLEYLHDKFGTLVPQFVLQDLKSAPVPGIERIEYQIAINPPTRWSALLELWCHHSRLMENATLLSRLITFPRFLQSIWGVPLWKVPFYGSLKMMTWYKNRLARNYQ